ncbi:uncharacterized protein LY89DRAFT_617358 [Mollisia scopiformis]|uniref:Uncharacterized protein n=1 Tax=Mollisia scopiformis TaxID=149040 RepID=A0A194X7V6_MOLSC|nr:uncharacterized protein LY89DRAFT_617358 [Mollisia scopiformis]KUJ16251.1 hypothetical protein LY89DRAFT_617358 [Mollisia scopiformis]
MIFEQDIPTPLRIHTKTSLDEEPSSDTLPNDLDVKLSDIFSAMASMENTPPSSEEKRVKRDDLKLEELMTPSKSDISFPKSVRFNDVIEEMLLDPYSRSPSNDSVQKLMDETLGDALRQANQRAEQEKLVAADVNARVDVPIMDFSKPDPPWKDFEGIPNQATLMSRQMSFIRDVIGQRLPKLLHAGHKDINLKWSPFPASLAKIAVEEHFPDDDNNLQTFWKDMESGEIIDSSSLTWKPEGLRILKDDEDDEEIECGTFRTDTPRDLSSLVKKRKLELQEENEAREEIGRKKVAPAAQDLPITRQLAKDMGNSKDGRHEKSRSGGGAELGSLFGDAFSAENCLDNFLEVRGSKKAKLTDSSYFGTKPDKAQSAPAPQRTITPQLNTTPLALRNSPVAKAPPLPAPSLPEVPPSTSIVVSSTLLKHRSLIKYLERLLPALNIIERDFIAHNTTAWLPGSVTLSPVKSPLDSEADLIVSPSTGIVITTLQKIKQKPLPGQKSKPAIRDRLEKVSGRYEKLIVLITEGRIDETTLGLDESDCLAYSEFAGFAAGFETSITVLFVAGGEETLTKWLASTIVQHCVAGESSLLADETHWELFLRRAGLNAYAAQAILAELKAPDGVDPASPLKAGQFGLIAFIEMGRGQRIERFAPLCGRVLVERVSALIEGNWE